MTLEAGTLVGKYVIKRMLTEGGMAEIYLATSTGPEGFEKEVVIKRVRSFLAGDEGFVKMFIAEARLASRLNHANVVQIFDFDKHEDSYYLAMEYVRGCSLWELRKRCREKGVAVPPVLVAHIGAQVAAGLHYAHRLKGADGESLRLVHRDVTPHNVLLSFDGAVKLTDFGIAKAGHTQSGMLKGKFSYMSPEQARGEEVDSRTDVFALGIVLWEMLTGGRLFDGDSDIAVLRAVQESAITPPARLNPDVPEDLDEVVSVALERDLEARFQSAGELERALAQCVLRHVRSVDDTDVGTFARRMLDAPLTQFIPMPAALMERPARSRADGMPATGLEAHPDKRTPSPSSREPTAVLPRSGASSGRGKSVRTALPEESLVSASTLVLSRDAQADEDRRAAPSESPSSRLKPAAPMRVAQVMPAVTSMQEPVPAKRGGKRLWVGVGVAALALIGGAAALVMPSKEPAASNQAPTPIAKANEAPPASPTAGASAPPEVKTEAPSTTGSGSAATEVLDAGTVAAVTPPPAPKATGTLTVRAVPYADVYLDGKLIKRELQRPMSLSLAPGTYRLTFKHPARSESFDVTIKPNETVPKAFNARR